MHKSIIALAFAAGVGIYSFAAGATPMTAGSSLGVAQSAVQPAQYWGGGYCARLRRACQFKYERGEVGEGNCRRYREECGGRASYCERLRRACVYKYERGEVGEGNCRRYRAECRGRW